MRSKKVKIIVLDSIAALFRGDDNSVAALGDAPGGPSNNNNPNSGLFGAITSAARIEKTARIFSIAQQLKIIVDEFGAPCIVINQVADYFVDMNETR
jgi:hypothetical protein